VFVFVPLVNATAYLTYKAELTASQTIYEKTSAAADVSVQLGGRTSNVAKMRLTLVNSEGQAIRTILDFRLGGR
jgi:hypothetical protein